MTIIGISGRKRSGKDTVCALIQERLGRKAVRFAFADALKKEFAGATGVPVKVIESEKDRFRLGLQWWGTEFRRGENENYWVEKLANSLIAAGTARSCDIAIVPDCRFPNEADAIRRMGGKVIRIQRHSCGNEDRHPSETAMDDYSFDHTIWNHGTLEDLRETVDNIIPILAGPNRGTNGMSDKGNPVNGCHASGVQA